MYILNYYLQNNKMNYLSNVQLSTAGDILSVSFFFSSIQQARI